MSLTPTLSLLFSLLLYTCNAFDITQILNQYPEFSTFNSYLTQTNLAADINSRQTITVLVVDNANAAPLSAKPVDEIKNILAVHVILDYFDVPKLQQLSGGSSLVTTLFQSTGLARGQQGFLNVTRIGTGSIAIGSAMPGSPLGSNLVKSVVTQPYNFSVVQVSSPIIPQGIDGAKTSAPTVTPGASPPMPSTVIPATSPPIAAASPPQASLVSAPSMAPPNPISPSVSSIAPPPVQTTASPLPSTATPAASTTPVPTTAPTKAAGPAMASTPSASPASTPGPAAGPGAETPTTEESEDTIPTGPPRPKNGVATMINGGIAGVFTVVLSTLYLASRI